MTAARVMRTICATTTQLSETTGAFDLVHAMTLLYWGLRLDHVGRHDEAADRLHRSAAITRRHADQRPDRQPGDHADQDQAHESTAR